MVPGFREIPQEIIVLNLCWETPILYPPLGYQTLRLVSSTYNMTYPDLLKRTVGFVRF